MNTIRSVLSIVVPAGVLWFGAVPLWAQQGVIYKAEAKVDNYCHLKFPAIREETLSWDRPVLKDKSDGDIIDFYGPCNYDPLGKEEIQRQRLQLLHELTRGGE